MNRYKLTKAGVDVNQALRRLGDDKEFYEELLRKFCEDRHYSLLKQALEEEEVSQAFRYAHSLKGLAGNLSFVRLYDALGPMVEELRAGNLAGAEKFLPEVAGAYEALMEVLGDEGAKAPQS